MFLIHSVYIQLKEYLVNPTQRVLGQCKLDNIVFNYKDIIEKVWIGHMDISTHLYMNCICGVDISSYISIPIYEWIYPLAILLYMCGYIHIVGGYIHLSFHTCVDISTCLFILGVDISTCLFICAWIHPHRGGHIHLPIYTWVDISTCLFHTCVDISTHGWIYPPAYLCLGGYIHLPFYTCVDISTCFFMRVWIYPPVYFMYMWIYIHTV